MRSLKMVYTVLIILISLIISACARASWNIVFTSSSDSEPLYIYKGDNVTAKCSILPSEYENTPIFWYRNDTEIKRSSDKFQFTSNKRILNIFNISDPTPINIQCIAKDQNLQYESEKKTIKFASLGTKFEVEPVAKSASIGETVKMDCLPPKGYPAPTVHWEKNGKALTLTERIQQGDLGYLLINSAERKDSGSYVCVADSNFFIRRTSPKSLNIFVKPLIKKGNEDISHTVGDNFTLPCKILKGDPPPIVVWEHSVKMFTGNATASGLVFTNVEESSAGKYKCIAKNEAGIDFKEYRVDIIGAPKFIAFPKAFTAQLNTTVKIPCRFGYKVEVKYWNLFYSTNPQMVYQGNNYSSNIHVTSEGDLVIQRVNKSVEGNHGCAVVYQSKTYEATVHMVVVDKTHEGLRSIPPPLIKVIPWNVTVAQNSKLELPCKAVGDPTPIITWKKSGKTITKSKRFKFINNSLVINKIRVNDAGLYTCIASNQRGVYNKTISISVKDRVQFKPKRIVDVLGKPFAKRVNQSHITIGWEINKRIYDYRIEYSGYPMKEWAIAGNEIRGSEFDLENLNPATEYFFIIRSCTLGRCGESSPMSDPIHTALGIKHTKNMTIDYLIHITKISLREPIVLNSTAIRVNWDVENLHHYVKGFFLHYSLKPGEELVKDANNGSYRSFVLSGLRPYTVYNITITPYYIRVQDNSFDAQSSQYITSRTLPAVPSSSPRNLKTKVTGSRMFITWQAPEKVHWNAPTLVGYRIVIIGGNGETLLNNVTNANTLQIEQLPRIKRLSIRIAAINTVGEGEFTPSLRVELDLSPMLFYEQNWFYALIGGFVWILLVGCALCYCLRHRCCQKKPHRKLSLHQTPNVYALQFHPCEQCGGQVHYNSPDLINTDHTMKQLMQQPGRFPNTSLPQIHTQQRQSPVFKTPSTNTNKVASPHVYTEIPAEAYVQGFPVPHQSPQDVFVPNENYCENTSSSAAGAFMQPEADSNLDYNSSQPPSSVYSLEEELSNPRSDSHLHYVEASQCTSSSPGIETRRKPPEMVTGYVVPPTGPRAPRTPCVCASTHKAEHQLKEHSGAPASGGRHIYENAVLLNK